MSELTSLDDVLESLSPVHWPRVQQIRPEFPDDDKSVLQLATDQLLQKVTDHGVGANSLALAKGQDTVLNFDRHETHEKGHPHRRREKVLIIDGESRARIFPRYEAEKPSRKCSVNDRRYQPLATDAIKSKHGNDETREMSVHENYWRHHRQKNQAATVRPLNNDNDGQLSPWITRHDSASFRRRDGNHIDGDWAVRTLSETKHFQHASPSVNRAVSLSPIRQSSSPAPNRLKRKPIRAKTADSGCSTLSPGHLATVSGRIDESKKRSNRSLPKTKTASNEPKCVFIVDYAKYDAEKLVEATHEGKGRQIKRREVAAATTTTKEEDVVRGRRARCATCCRSFIAFLFSTIGLTCLLVGYVVLGGIVFVQLEADNEHRTAEDMNKIRQDHVRRLWVLTERMNVLHPDNWTADADQILENYTECVHSYVKKKGWVGSFSEDSEQQWSFAGALLYSITVITTIGTNIFLLRYQYRQHRI
jgi:hypothetical protein